MDTLIPSYDVVDSTIWSKLVILSVTLYRLFTETCSIPGSSAFLPVAVKEPGSEAVESRPSEGVAVLCRLTRLASFFDIEGLS
jgi:hypothetical protein